MPPSATSAAPLDLINEPRPGSSHLIVDSSTFLNISPNTPAISLPIQTSYTRPVTGSHEPNVMEEQEKKRRRRRGGAGVDIGLLMDYEVPLGLEAEQEKEKEAAELEGRLTTASPQLGLKMKSRAPSDGAKAAEYSRLPALDKANKVLQLDGCSSSASSSSSHQPETPKQDEYPRCQTPILDSFSPQIDGEDYIHRTPSSHLSPPPKPPLSPVSPDRPFLPCSTSSASSTYLPYRDSPKSPASVDPPVPPMSPSLNLPRRPSQHLTGSSAVPPSPASTTSIYSTHSTPNITLDITSPRSDDSEGEDSEEWDIVGDYARASMYAPFGDQSLAQAQEELDRQNKSPNRSERGPEPLPALILMSAEKTLPIRPERERRESTQSSLSPSRLSLPMSPPLGRRRSGGTLSPLSAKAKTGPHVPDESRFVSTSKDLPSPSDSGSSHLQSPSQSLSPSSLAPSPQILDSLPVQAHQRTASANTLRPIDTMTPSSETSYPSLASSPPPLSPPSFLSSEALSHSPTFAESSNSTFHATTEIDLSSASDPVPITFFLGQESSHHQRYPPSVQQINGKPSSSSIVSPASSTSPTSPKSPGSYPRRAGSASDAPFRNSPLIGLGFPSSPLASSFVLGGASTLSSPEDGRRSVTAPTFSPRSRESSQTGEPLEQPRPSFFPGKKDRPRSRTFSGQTLELGYPLYLESEPEKQQAFLSMSTQPTANNVPYDELSTLTPSPPRGFRDHRPSLGSALTVQSDLRPPPSSALMTATSRSSLSSPRSPLIQSTGRSRSSQQSSLGVVESGVINGGPKSSSALGLPPVSSPITRHPHSSPHQPTRSVSATSPKSTALNSTIEPSTPKRSIFSIFRSRSASVSTSSRASNPIVSSPLPPVPTRVDYSPSQSPASLSFPSPSYSSDNPLPLTPKFDSSNVSLTSSCSIEHETTPHQSSIPPMKSPNPSLSTNGDRARNADSEPLRIPSPLKNVKSTSSLKANVQGPSHLASPLRSPKSIGRLRKQASLSPFTPPSSQQLQTTNGNMSPPKKLLALAAPISSRDFQEESVKEGGLEVRLFDGSLSSGSESRGLIGCSEI